MFDCATLKVRNINTGSAKQGVDRNNKESGQNIEKTIRSDSTVMRFKKPLLMELFEEMSTNKNRKEKLELD
jgi:hypothetical protein